MEHPNSGSAQAETPLSKEEKQAQIQAEVKALFIKTATTRFPFRLAIYAGPGVGKTKGAIDCATWHYDNIIEGDTLVVCHSKNAQKINWPQQLSQWAPPGHPIAKAERVIYRSLSKIKGRHFGRVILDEAHYITSEEFFKNNRIDCVIVVTATEPRDSKKRRILKELVGTNIYVKSMDDAADEGVVNDYEVHVMCVELDKHLAYLPGRTGEGTITEWQAYGRKCAYIQRLKDSGDFQGSRTAYAQLISFLSSTETKMRAAKVLLTKMRAKQRRFIVFCHSKAQADALSPYPYHSGTSEVNYERFCEMEISELATIKQIKEGANLPKLPRGLILQLDSNPGNFIQMTGRLLREEVGVTAAMFILVVKGTYEYDWCLKALAKIHQKRVSIHMIDKAEYWPEALALENAKP